MSIEIGRAYFRALGMEDRVREFDVSSATVELAAQALGVEGARIAKTLSFKLPEEKPILILAAGDARIDNHNYKEKFHTKAKMLTPDEVMNFIGHPIGGVCPFGIKDGVDVYLDESLKRFETVFPAVGSASSAIELNLEELFETSKALEWIDVCKLPEYKKLPEREAFFIHFLSGYNLDRNIKNLGDLHDRINMTSGCLSKMMRRTCKTPAINELSCSAGKPDPVVGISD